ncbi:hypothetical protein COX69_02860 [Candidatus Falkowbacteria bacterium CG_4_10_14_0_2_um_filter_48_10]|uniref:Polysaccharide chain length determinant N-terminal domain-containing protein n=1 Tax=Candidatus Falkowbacteria bacterium CG23_combo_of_CG06-09_8_20_14_all_49_15 TaxID=1974572 RepID=A0A2G9ZLE4_9BACT|nr:MAG: hypothetical protein COX22_04525 [Candidatus Falkowbacteria bacterium CG23_combo_of_CG06-09_8_20_14_all_49_15]PJA08224.1 MAG: hypothetical protein COX69_02860 [Candidatus Falkowbacteria bacterium CG_4_10_14_0_2_um_filter_48_10]
MLNINLISPEIKKESELRKLNGLIIRLGWPLIIISTALSLYFLAGLYLLRYQIAKNTNSGISAEIFAQNSGQELKILNNAITIIDGLQAEYFDPFPLLQKIAGFSSSGVKFTQITINKTNNEAIFKGLSARRDDLLAFKKKLEESNSFQDIVLPINNLLLKENIIFDIKARITNYEN